MKTSIFWDISPRISLKTNGSFGAIFRLLLQGQIIRKARSQHEAGSKLNFSCCLFPAGFFVDYQPTLKIVATSSAETLADFQRNIRCYMYVRK
jgi:hypothetical protein